MKNLQEKIDLMKRRAINIRNAEKFRNDINWQEVGKEDNGNIVFKNNRIEAILSDREMEVYKMKLKSNSSIANHLNISELSVENYRKKITSKGF